MFKACLRIYFRSIYKPMRHPNRHLLKILGLGWLSFLGLGLGLRQLLPRPTLVVIIDHSFCPPAQQQRVIADYIDLYQQHQRRQILIERVVLLSNLSEEVRIPPPIPEAIESLGFFGELNPDALQQTTQKYPASRVLSCL